MARRRFRVDPWTTPNLEWDSTYVSRWMLSFYIVSCIFQTIGLFTVNAPVFAEAATPRGAAVSATLSWSQTSSDSTILQAVVGGESEGEEAANDEGRVCAPFRPSQPIPTPAHRTHTLDDVIRSGC